MLLTKHVEKRMCQRGIRAYQIDFVLAHGVQQRLGVYMVTEKVLQRIRPRRPEAFRNLVLVAEGESIVSVWRQTRVVTNRVA